VVADRDAMLRGVAHHTVVNLAGPAPGTAEAVPAPEPDHAVAARGAGAIT